MCIRDRLEDSVNFTRWVCRISDEGWKLYMQLESGGLIKQIAQLDLYVLENTEVDLFQMAKTLFNMNCNSNDLLYKAQTNYHAIQEEVDSLKQERALVDKVLEERDNKTRTIVVGLLNEKKKKIAELRKRLLKALPDMPESDISDSEIINKHITNPVSSLNSPGKKGRKAKLKKIGSIKKPDIKRKKLKPSKLVQKPKAEHSDFDDFQFYGISRRTPEKADNMDCLLYTSRCV